MASTAPAQSPAREPLKLSPGAAERMLSSLVLAIVVTAIGWGWWHRGALPFDPHRGLGYALGIVGGSMMIVLLGYPLRKRLRGPSKRMGSVGFWFRFHMLLGLMGPLAILYHARFTWGALNSAFALGAMVVVASSGLIGRYFYSRVHRGYSGRKLEMRALRDEMDALLAGLGSSGGHRAALIERLTPFEARAIAAGGAFWSSARAVIGLGVETRRAERDLLREPIMLHDSGGEAMSGAVRDYFEAVRRAAEFAFYDRLLRLWHLLHLPLFVLLVAAAMLHIVAVHMY